MDRRRGGARRRRELTDRRTSAWRRVADDRGIRDIRASTVRLGAIAGRWRTEGMVLGDEPVPVRGTDTYELLPGGFYLVHWVDVTVGDQPVRAIEIIGERVAGTDAVLARAYDDTGAMTVMQVHIGADGVWRSPAERTSRRPRARTAGPRRCRLGRRGRRTRLPQLMRPPRATPVARRSGSRPTGDMTALWERADDGVTCGRGWRCGSRCSSDLAALGVEQDPSGAKRPRTAHPVAGSVIVRGGAPRQER